MSSKRWAAALAVVLFSSLMAFGQPPPGKESFADTFFLPAGVVAEPKGRTGFVPNGRPERIDAVDLQTGKVLWTTKEAYRPLLAAGGRLVALAKVEGKRHTLRLVVLDASAKGKGKLLLTSAPVVFAPGNTGGWFLLVAPEVALDKKGELLLKWYIKQTSGPRVIGRRPVAGGTIVCKESLRINLTTGRVDKLPEKDWPTLRLPEKVEKVKDRRLYYMFRGRRRMEPFIVGTVAVVLGDTQDDRPGLLRWDAASGKELLPIVLAKEHPAFLYVTSDKRHVLAYIGLPEKELVKKGLATDRRIFALETGEQVGRFPFDPNALDFAVRGPVLYYYFQGEPGHGPTPRYLRAHDLKTGKPLWTLRLQDKRNGEWWH
jgi:hypothetical protein